MRALTRQYSMAAIIVLAMVLAVAGCNQETGRPSGLAIPVSASPLFVTSPAIAFAENPTALSDVAERCVRSVVNISSTRIVRTDQNQVNPFFRQFFPDMPQEQMAMSLGSGVIVSQDGLILTNNHVVEDSDQLRVQLWDGRQFDAEIVGTDPPSDVAVIRLKAPANDLEALPIADSDSLRLAEVVLAIGNPFGLNSTVTMGIVSALGRADIDLDVAYKDFIQTDAAINPGNSGGALINLHGELVGISTAIESSSGGYQGVGFAIPANMARVIMEKLITDGKIVRGYLGVSIQEITPDIAEAMNLGSRNGVLVAQVQPDTPAEKAGVQSGDVIIRLNGDQITTVSKFMNDIALLAPDSVANLTVIRNGNERNIPVTLAERPGEDQLASGTQPRSRQGSATVGGLSLSAITDQLRQTFQIPDNVQSGVVITDIDPASNAATSGLRQGDVIIEINRTRVNSVADFTSNYNSAQRTVLLLVNRQGVQTFITLRK